MMRVKRRERLLPNFEAASLALFAFAALAANVPLARAQSFGPGHNAKPGLVATPSRSAASAATTTQALRPAPAASRAKR